MLMRDDPQLTRFRPHLEVSLRRSDHAIDDLDAGKLALCLKGNTHLQCLVLAADPNLTSRGARALASSICESQITTLDLRNYQPDVDSSLITILLEDGVAKSKSLQDLCFGGPVGDFPALCTAFSSLKSLYLLHCRLRADVQILSDGLKNTNTLETLYLDGTCWLSDQEMRILSLGLHQNSSLKVLNFDGNQIGDEGIAAFVENWNDESQIEDISLSGNRIRIEGALVLLQAVSRHPSMHTLNLSNHEFGYDGLQRIAELVPELRLKRFEIDSCTDVLADESDEEVLVAIKDEVEAAGNAMLRGMQENVHWIDSYPDFTYFPKHVDQGMMCYLELNKFGRYLLSRDVVPGLWSHVLACCGSRANVVYFFLREQPDLMLAAASNKRLPSKKMCEVKRRKLTK
jgi:hypothetical protein